MLITTTQAVGNLAASDRPRARSAAPRDDTAAETSPDQRIQQVRAAAALHETNEENHLPPGSLYDIRA